MFAIRSGSLLLENAQHQIGCGCCPCECTDGTPLPTCCCVPASNPDYCGGTQQCDCTDPNECPCPDGSNPTRPCCCDLLFSDPDWCGFNSACDCVDTDPGCVNNCGACKCDQGALTQTTVRCTVSVSEWTSVQNGIPYTVQPCNSWSQSDTATFNTCSFVYESPIFEFVGSNRDGSCPGITARYNVGADYVVGSGFDTFSVFPSFPAQPTQNNQASCSGALSQWTRNDVTFSGGNRLGRVVTITIEAFHSGCDPCSEALGPVSNDLGGADASIGRPAVG